MPPGLVHSLCGEDIECCIVFVCEGYWSLFWDMFLTSINVVVLES